jgi:carboxypeptidase Q
MNGTNFRAKHATHDASVHPSEKEKTEIPFDGNRSLRRHSGVKHLAFPVSAVLWITLVAPPCPAAETPPALPELAGYGPAARRLMDATTNATLAFRRLEYLCDRFGPRFSGTTNLELALDWVMAEMKRDGFDRVQAEEVPVPCWVRGPASLEMLAPRPQALHLTALGGTVATPPDGTTAEALVVRDFQELTNRAAEAKGKLIVFNFPFTGYGSGFPYRVRGAVEAAKVGAVGSLIRSLTPFSLETPHTGMMRYEAGVPQIPHAALSVEDTLLLQRWQDRGERIRLRLKLEAKTGPDVLSRNVLAELTGREKPDEFVIVGGHSDSWDLSPGAMDDAGGCLAAWEAVRLLHELKLRPRRTVRVVLWVNEENGLRGARAYRTNHLAELPRHILAIESDIGVFRPEGFSFSGTGRLREIVTGVAGLLEATGATRIMPGGGGADTSPLDAEGVPTMELQTERERYFWYHHTAADTVDKLDRQDFNRCVASLAVMVYVVADWPENLRR